MLIIKDEKAQTLYIFATTVEDEMLDYGNVYGTMAWAAAGRFMERSSGLEKTIKL